MKHFFALIFFASLLSATSCHSTKKTALQTTTVGEADNEHDATSFEQAVKVRSIREEYQWVGAHHQSLELKGQALVFKDKKPFDVLTFTRTDGSEQKFYFDISSFYGKH
jgi:hypothetical protein